MSQEPIGLEGQIAGMGMFVGKFTHNLDPKRRLTIPSVWRSQIGKPEGVYVVPDYEEQCLAVYPAQEMSRKIEEMRRHPMGEQKLRRFARSFGANAELLPWDVQGRIRIREELLTWAGLKDAVVLVGALDRIELWSPESSAAAAGLDVDTLRQLGPHAPI